jgi:RNA polymerase primary sigma factor
MLQAVLNSSVAVEELLEIGERLRRGKVRVKDVIKDIDEDEEDFNEQYHVDRVCKVIDKVRKLQRDCEKLEEKTIDKGIVDKKKSKTKEGIRDLHAQMFVALSDLRLNKPTVDRIVLQLKMRAPRRHGRQRAQQDAARDAVVERQDQAGRQEDRDVTRRTSRRWRS